MDAPHIAAVEDVPEDGSYLFRVTDDGEEREAILVHLADGVAGWLNSCRHYTHVPLDKGSGAAIRDGEIVCRNHGAMFEVDSGLCTFGPCEGATLVEVAVAVEDGAVHLVDDEFGYAGDGPLESDPVDLASDSNLEF
jgi:nitrite reductase/ring-hydroxylating ferredoxin subunit